VRAVVVGKSVVTTNAEKKTTLVQFRAYLGSRRRHIGSRIVEFYNVKAGARERPAFFVFGRTSVRLEQSKKIAAIAAENLPIFSPGNTGKQRLTRKVAEVYWKAGETVLL
jgi:hypothetical protein